MMKLIYILTIISINSSITYSQNHFFISGTIDGIDTGFVSLNFSNANYVSRVKDGKFYIEGEVNYPIWANLALNNNESVSFFLEPNTIKFSSKFNEFSESQIFGSKSQYTLDSLNKVKANKYFAISRIKGLLSNLEDSKDSILIHQLKDSLFFYNRSIFNIDSLFIKRNPFSYISPFILANYIYEDNANSTLNELFDTIDEEVKLAPPGIQIGAYISSVPGKKAKSFVRLDLQKNMVDLDSFIRKGKYVILDFWATWCIPCIAEFPELIEFGKKYQKYGLEVITIARDDGNEEMWEKAILKYKLENFYNVLNGEWHSGVGAQYGVVPIPVKILIGPDGIILMRIQNGGKIDLLKERLIEIFGF